METIKYFLEKYRKIIIIIFLIIIALISIILLPKGKAKDKTEDIKLVYDPKLEEKKSENVIDIKKIKVDVKGAVVNPGVYELEENSRVQDAINKAGGLSENANIEYINLSKILKDEMIIIIYTEQYIEDFKNKDKEPIYIKYECECPDKINDACVTSENIINDTTEPEKKEEENDTFDEVVSINTGTLEELMTLNGIGESKARAIIEYREQNGLFNNLEDIMNVPGIGESAYKKIKDNIKL